MTVPFPPIAKSIEMQTSLPQFTYKFSHREKGADLQTSQRARAT